MHVVESAAGAEACLTRVMRKGRAACPKVTRRSARLVWLWSCVNRGGAALAASKAFIVWGRGRRRVWDLAHCAAVGPGPAGQLGRPFGRPGRNALIRLGGGAGQALIVKHPGQARRQRGPGRGGARWRQAARVVPCQALRATHWAVETAVEREGGVAARRHSHRHEAVVVISHCSRRQRMLTAGAERA